MHVTLDSQVRSGVNCEAALLCFLTQRRCEHGQIQVAVLVVVVVVSYKKDIESEMMDMYDLVPPGHFLW